MPFWTVGVMAAAGVDEVEEVVVLVLPEVVLTVVSVVEAAADAIPRVDSIEGANVLPRLVRFSAADFAAP